MRLYAESSAIVAWLMAESGYEGVLKELERAELVLASDLTLAECGRVLIKGIATDRLTEADAAGRRAELNRAAEHWTILELVGEITERVWRPFPNEPVKTLDALHLAFALYARALVPGSCLLTLDERLRTAGRQLGFDVLPA